MENKFLQPLLKAGLLDIGDSDERLVNIQKSITDLEKVLKEDLPRIPSYTLVALDPNIEPDEPVLIEVEEIITQHWKALRAKFSETPVQIIRAVIINALYNIGKDDSKIARIVYLTASNLYPFVKLKKEKAVIEQLIEEFGEIAEKNATEVWALSSDSPKIVIKDLEIEDISIEAIEVNREELEGGMLTAIRNEAGTNYGTANGGNTSWGKHFAKNASSSISDAIDETFKQLEGAISSSSISDPINKFFKEFKYSLDQALNKSFNSMQAVERRSELLWWKETLYSSSLKNSYRSVNDIQQAIVMANDLYHALPEIFPVSVDYLLRDTLLQLNIKAGKKMKFVDLLNEIAKEENANVLKNHLGKIPHEQKRTSITNFVILLVNGEVTSDLFKKYTGIEDANQVSLLDIAVVILHDLMAIYLSKLS